MKQKTGLSYYGNSNVGLIRSNNEDAFVVQNIWNTNTVLAVAIDGVGGYDGGEVAAAIAQKTIPEYLAVSSNGERIELLKQAVTAANNAICDAKQVNSGFEQMCCVLTAAIIDVTEKQVSIAHVGDTRLYSYHNGVLKKLSHDHSLVGYREEIGDLTEEEAMHHPKRNEIIRDVGSQKHSSNDDDFIEAAVHPLEPNTIFLLCSDGLTDLITSAQIKEILGKKDSLKSKTDNLIAAALDAGGKDNVTVVLVKYQDSEARTEIQPFNKKTEGAYDDDQQCEIITQTINNKSFKILSLVLAFIIGVLMGATGMFFMNGGKKPINKNADKQELYDSITNGTFDSIIDVQNYNHE